MINKTEREERIYLEEIKGRLNKALIQIDNNVEGYSKDLLAQKEYLYENKADMDHVEKVAVHQSVHAAVLTGEAALERKKRFQKLMLSPYFGRFDFAEKDARQAIPIYLGVHAYFDENTKENMVHDWRAPISTMFYDYETGPAKYQAPYGPIDGTITLKRQFRIRHGEMEYMLESALNIHDDVLQKELSKASDDKMKHIVATIQRDQNAIIRNETSQTLIIQGVAGSGKTSIALHRIAFLLYRFKETISSKDILILSPNKVFADYISNVLPELGEEKIPELGMEELATQLLEDKFRFQTFFEQVSALLEKKDETLRHRIAYKSSFDMLTKLNEYLTYIENNYFTPKDLMVKRYPVPASYIEERFRAYHRLPLFTRFNTMVEDIERDLLFYNSCEIMGKERNDLRKDVKAMFGITNLRELYKDFYAWLGQTEMLKMAPKNTYEYADVFPLIYLKTKLEGTKVYNQVKHLLVDEMQDYTPVQYAVLGRLFPCKKTILGDANQTVNPYGSSNSETISRALPGADCMKLTKSYRSTCEIAHFAQCVSPASDLEVIERHGEAPEIVTCKSYSDELKQIEERIKAFQQSGHHSLGIICKTQKQSDHLYAQLFETSNGVKLLTANSLSFSSGITICTTHLSKGLEFDEVIIPHADANTYSDNMDRGLLYIACTRAMHRLTLIHTGEVTPLLNQANNSR
jgi:DNA helicase II / ATP-dependent DNA helicase PcrA